MRHSLRNETAAAARHDDEVTRAHPVKGHSSTMRSVELGPRAPEPAAPSFPHALDHHLVSEPIAAGGMASVHVAASPDPQAELLALKRLHSYLADDPHFEQMLLDEAAIASCVRHPNVVTTYGADQIGSEVYVVMELVRGLSLHVLMQKGRGRSVPPRLAAAILASTLRGLHAAHDAVDARHQALHIVHRDVSPQNILIGVDGVVRVFDFGIAKAERRRQQTRVGDVKGKLSYMSPEQIHGAKVDRRTDVYAAAVVLWEALVGTPLFNGGGSDGNIIARVLAGEVTRPGALVTKVPVALDAIVMRGLAQRARDRFATALEMAEALDTVFAADPVQPSELSAWVCELGGETLKVQARMRAELRQRALAPVVMPVPTPVPPPMSMPQAPVLIPRAPRVTTVPSARKASRQPEAPLQQLVHQLLRELLHEKLALVALGFMAAVLFGLLTEIAVSKLLVPMLDTSSDTAR